jgi:hypothetical protein
LVMIDQPLSEGLRRAISALPHVKQCKVLRF